MAFPTCEVINSGTWSSGLVPIIFPFASRSLKAILLKKESAGVVEPIIDWLMVVDVSVEFVKVTLSTLPLLIVALLIVPSLIVAIVFEML